jgi:hypothetical protein
MIKKYPISKRYRTKSGTWYFLAPEEPTNPVKARRVFFCLGVYYIPVSRVRAELALGFFFECPPNPGTNFNFNLLWIPAAPLAPTPG